MIIHFVAQAFDYSYMCSDAKKIEIGDENHDPISGVASFQSFFDRIDGKGKRDTMRLDTEKVRFAFWDREDFLESLRETCKEDVYIQASDWYSMTIAFVSVTDRDAYDQRLSIPRECYEVSFDRTLRNEIDSFLKNQLEVTRNEYDTFEHGTADNLSGLGATVLYKFRDRGVSELVHIKFASTKQGDHSHAAPPIPAAFA